MEYLAQKFLGYLTQEYSMQPEERNGKRIREQVTNFYWLDNLYRIYSDNERGEIAQKFFLLKHHRLNSK